MTPQRLRRLAISLGWISSIGIFVALLALTDIYHGRETDLSQEWTALRIAFAAIIAFHVAAVAALRRSGPS